MPYLSIKEGLNMLDCHSPHSESPYLWSAVSLPLVVLSLVIEYALLALPGSQVVFIGTGMVACALV